MKKIIEFFKKVIEFFKKVIEFFKSVFTKSYWVQDFQETGYDEECFMCNESSCQGCPYL